MATTYTTNYNLGKQENHADKFDMDVITDNADKIDAALTGLQSDIDGKQDALSSEQLAAVNSGIDTTKVGQIETNKNNILSTCCVGTCTTAGDVAAKIVTIDDPNWVLRKGCIIGVKFTYSNRSSIDNVTLNVNNTGDKSIYYNNNVYTSHDTKVCGTANTYIYYMYDGTYWCWINYGFDSTYTSMTQSEATTGTAATARLISAKVLSDTIDEKIQPLENNISLLAMRKVYASVHNTSTSHTYTMKVSDFNNSQAGTYLITLVTWSTTPSFSLYAASYSGNQTTVTNLTKIAGADANIAPPINS